MTAPRSWRQRAGARLRTGRTGEIVRFSLIGILNTGCYYAFFRLGLTVLPYLVAHVLAFGVCLVVSFLLNCRFTFHVRPTWGRLLRFPLANLTTFVVMSLGVTLLVEVVRVEPDLAALVIAVATVPITFAVSRLLLLGTLRGRDSPGSPP